MMRMLVVILAAAGAILSLSEKCSAADDVQFRDVTEKAGIHSPIISGGTAKDYVLEVNGSGVCWFDYNNDGYADLYLVNGSTLEALQGKKPRPVTNHLYRNNGNKTFTDVTESARVPGSGWGFGCAAADYDNDGKTDLLVTNFGRNNLYHNNGDGTFSEVGQHAGIAGGDIWHTGAAFGDYDNDGYVDLYIAGYLDFNIRNPERKNCDYHGVKVHACGPLGYRGAPDALYHNNGDGTFSETTKQTHVVDRNLYFGFTVVFDDLDDDGRPDIFVANDSNPNYFYRNKGDGTFEEIGVSSGLAFNADGKEMSSMGVATGDYDNDGQTDLYITTFSDDNYVLYHNDGKGTFSDVSFQSGVGEHTIPYLGWATFFFDYNNDGWKDLFNANGHVYPEMGQRTKESYREPLQLFENLQNRKFAEVSPSTGLGALPLKSARGGAYCDYDNDGDLDILVSNIDERPQLLENAASVAGRWLELKLVGTKSNRDAIGAKVKVTAGNLVQYDRVRAGGSYISGNDLRLHFGLGDRPTIDLVEIQWPSGAQTSLPNVKSNQILTVTEPK